MIVIKELTHDQLHVFLNLINELAKHHNQKAYIQTTIDKVSNALLNSKFNALIAYDKNAPIGYASYTWNYSIWAGEDYINLDDLYVKQAFRGNKIGEALMKRLKEICIKNRLKLIRWEVEGDNVRAIKFYKSLGATINTKGIFKWDVSNQL